MFRLPALTLKTIYLRGIGVRGRDEVCSSAQRGDEGDLGVYGWIAADGGPTWRSEAVNLISLNAKHTSIPGRCSTAASL